VAGVLGAKPGLKVLDIFAVYGWKTELLARAVAPGGKVYAQNSEAVFARVKDRLAARLKTPAAANIVSVVRPFEDPAPPGMHDFDLVTFFYAYHDVTYIGVDRAKMNKAFYDALKPGGELVVGDYSAKPEARTSVVKTSTVRTKRWSGRRSRWRGSNWSAMAIFFVFPAMPETPPHIHRRNPSIST
jgi:predicted methyltransferase